MAELRWSGNTSAEIIIYICGKLLRSHNNSGKEITLQKAENTQEAFTQLCHISKEDFIHFNNNVSCTLRTTPAVLLRTCPSFALPSQFSLITGENNQWSQLCERGSACHTTLQSHLRITSSYSSWKWMQMTHRITTSSVLYFPSPFWLPAVDPCYLLTIDARMLTRKFTDILPNTLQNSSGLSHYHILYFKTNAVLVTLKSQL